MDFSGQSLGACQKAQMLISRKMNKVLRTTCLDIVLTSFTELAIGP